MTRRARKAMRLQTCVAYATRAESGVLVLVKIAPTGQVMTPEHPYYDAYPLIRKMRGDVWRRP